MTMWLIRQEVARAMQDARRAGLVPTAEQAAEFHASRIQAMNGQPRSLAIAGDVAQINVHGTLTKHPDLWAMWFGEGNTAYTDIIAALAAASSDTKVKRVVLDVDSPGGYVDGLFELLAALENFDKPISARASQACSAAFAVAAMAGSIEATNEAAAFGSIGVAAQFWVFEDIVDITSTEAPDKRPDVSTEEGQAVIRKQLDDIHELFADAIARGRSTTVDKVNATYGRGAVLLAADAKRVGMIDTIAKPALRAVASNKTAPAMAGGAQPRKDPMTKDELRAQHPKLYEEILGEGKAAGEAGLHDLVMAHLVAGDASGDMKTAHEAIKAKTPMTTTLQTQYMMAAANRADRRVRQEETDTASAAAAGATPPAPAPTTKKDLGDQVAEALEKERGKSYG